MTDASRARQTAASNEAGSSSPYHRLDKFLADSLAVVDKRALPPDKASSQKEASQPQTPKTSDQPSTTNATKTSPEYLAIQQRMLQSMQPGRGSKSKTTQVDKAKAAPPPKAAHPTTAPKRNTPPPAFSSGMGRLPATRPRNPQSAPSESGTNAEWWSGLGGKGNKPGPSSVFSYPETAITDRHGEGSISGSEMMQYLNRLESLEAQVNAEKERKAKFQEDLKRLNPAAYAALQPFFSISRRGVTDSESTATSGVP